MIDDIFDSIDGLVSIVNSFFDFFNIVEAFNSLNSDKNKLSTYVFAQSNQNIKNEKFVVITTIVSSKNGKIRVIKKESNAIIYRKILVFKSAETYDAMEKIIDKNAKKYNVTFNIKNLKGRSYFQARRDIIRELKGKKKHPTTGST